MGLLIFASLRVRQLSVQTSEANLQSLLYVSIAFRVVGLGLQCYLLSSSSVIPYSSLGHVSIISRLLLLHKKCGICHVFIVEGRRSIMEYVGQLVMYCMPLIFLRINLVIYLRFHAVNTKYKSRFNGSDEHVIVFNYFLCMHMLFNNAF
jgi:hypothetical protein